MKIQTITRETDKVLEIAKNNKWGFRVYGDFGPLDGETYKDGWWYLPSDSIQIEQAHKRIEAIKNSGVKIRQVIVAHEAPKLLCAPKIDRKVEIPWKDIGMAARVVLRGVEMVLTVVMAGVGLVLALGIATLVDPAVIIVLEDGTWVEVVRWYE